MTTTMKESADMVWINHTLAGMWPEFQQVAQFMLDKKIMPMVKEKLLKKTDKVKDIKFAEFSLGKVAPALDKISVTGLPGGVAKVHVFFEYRSDMEVLLQVDTDIGELSSGIKNLDIKGDAVILIDMYNDSHPGTASVSLYLVEVPQIDFEFLGSGSFMNKIGLKDIMIDVMGMIMEKMFVLPNMITINAGLAEIKIYPPVMEKPDPLGMLRVKYVKGSLVQQKKEFSLLRALENLYETVDTWLGQMMGKDMSNYFQLKLGDAVWEPNVNATDQSFDFMVVDPHQRLFVSVWDRDIAGSDDQMSKIGPYHFDQLEALSGNELKFMDADLSEYAVGEFVFEWFGMEQGVASHDDSMVVVAIREIHVPGKFKSKLRVRAKLGDSQQSTKFSSCLKDKYAKKDVINTLAEVREKMAEAKLEESVIEQLLAMEPKLTRVSINSSMNFGIRTADLEATSLTLSLVQVTGNLLVPVETVLGEANIKLSDLKKAPEMNMPGPMIFSSSLGTITGEIDIQLCGAVPGRAPGPNTEVKPASHKKSYIEPDAI